MASPTAVVLDPAEVATGRTELQLNIGAINIGPDGPDWGDAAIEAYMAEAAIGQIPVDFRLPNRIITIPLLLGADGPENFATARSQLMAKVGLFQREGGWIKRATGRYADVVNASLKLPDKDGHLGVEADVLLTLEALPEFYGDEETLDDIVETTNPEIASVLNQGGVPAVIKGDYPGRVRVVVDEDDGDTQLGLLGGFRCRHYSPAATAALRYEAEALTPLDTAATATLVGASGGASNNIVQHTDLGAGWTPVLSTDILPAVRSIGAAASGTGNISPPLPSGWQPDDIFLLYIETNNEAVTPPAGWAHVTGSPVAQAGGNPTRLTVLWRRAVAGDTAPTITDPGDHCVGRIVAVSGCVKTGNPWDVTATAAEAVADTSVDIPGATTTVDGCLVLAAVATGEDLADTARISGWTNANLQTITEQIDTWVADGGGGGFGVASGIKLKAGAYGSTTATLVTANFKAQMSIALKPEPGGNKLTHTGTYRVWARLRSPDGSAVQARFVYDVGDLVLPEENDPWTFPVSSQLFLADLGQIRIDQVPVGAHRWQGQIQARGTVGGEDIQVDKLFFQPLDECAVKLRAPVIGSDGLIDRVARDGFNQSAGALAGKALPVGGLWAAAGNPTGLTVETTGHTAQRSTTTEVNPHFALAGTNVYAAIAVQTDFWGGVGVTALQGVFARYVDTNNFVVLYRGFDFIVLLKRVAGVDTFIKSTKVPLNRTSKQTLRLGVDATGRCFCWWVLTAAVMGAPLIVAQDSDLATGGVLASGRIGIYDHALDQGAAVTRSYDNFAAWVPNLDAVIHPNQSAELRTEGFYREDPTGVGWGPISDPSGSDDPRIPPSGLEGLPVEFFLLTSRGDLEQLPDGGIDDKSARVFYRASYLGPQM